MDNQTSEQAAFTAGDVQPNAGSIASVDVSDLTGKDNAATTNDETDDTTIADKKSGKNARIQKVKDAEWQKTQEKASAYDKLVGAITPDESEKLDPNADPVDLIQKKTSDLQQTVERLKWERKNLPQDISEEEEEKWEEACLRKADPTDSWHNLSYDEILSLSGVKLAPEANTDVEKVEQAANKQKFSNAYGRIPLMNGINPAEASDGRTQLDNEIASLAGLTTAEVNSK